MSNGSSSGQNTASTALRQCHDAPEHLQPERTGIGGVRTIWSIHLVACDQGMPHATGGANIAPP